MIRITDKNEKVDMIAKLFYEGENKEFSGEFQKIKFCDGVKIGLGKKEELSDEKLKRVIAQLIKQLIQQNIDKILIDIKGLSTSACVESAILTNYSFNKYKSKKNDFIKEIYFKNANKEDYEKTKIICEAVNYARDLSNEPAGIIYPESFAKIASELDNVEVWDEKKLEQKKFYGTLTVGKGSDKSSRVVIIKHLKGRNKDNPIVLIGKGVTFDSGGYDIKSAKNMSLMHTDMSGGATILGTMKAVQKLNIKTNIIGIIPLAENLISGNSYKPSDIIKAMNNITVEVDNTDAEGRLLLMDALAYSNKLKPKIVIDIATLTGAVKYALGNIYTGTFTEENDLWEQINIAGEKTGDKVWRLPCDKDFDRYIKGEIADWSNSGKNSAGAITASRFLEKFAPKRWIHLDIAGTARMEEDFEYFRKGSSGAGVRLLIEFLKNQV